MCWASPRSPTARRPRRDLPGDARRQRGGRSSRSIAIARNTALPRALSYAGRNERVPTIPTRVVEALVAVWRDEADNIEVRRQAVRTLGALPARRTCRPSSTCRQTESVWLAKEGMTTLAGSGDPRAREFLRAAPRGYRRGGARDRHPRARPAVRHAAGRGAAPLRVRRPPLRARARRRIAEVGGAENVRWLLDLARRETSSRARSAARRSSRPRAPAPRCDLVKLYDAVSDYALKEALVCAFAGERAALDKLIAIVGGETNVNVRRRAISALARLGRPAREGSAEGHRDAVSGEGVAGSQPRSRLARLRAGGEETSRKRMIAQIGQPIRAIMTFLDVCVPNEGGRAWRVTAPQAYGVGGRSIRHSRGRTSPPPDAGPPSVQALSPVLAKVAPQRRWVPASAGMTKEVASFPAGGGNPSR